jgi:hypothetical protein
MKKNFLEYIDGESSDAEELLQDLSTHPELDEDPQAFTAALAQGVFLRENVDAEDILQKGSTE